MFDPNLRHGRACPGHPRLYCISTLKTWMPGTSPGMTVLEARDIRGKMKIAKLEDFHVDCGWEDYSFLKITTDEGLVGWSEFRESRRKGMRALIHGMSELLIGAD